MSWTRSCSLLHPFMPFITEEIWQAIPHEGETLIVRPVARSTARTSASKRRRTPWSMIMQAIRAVRNRRSEMNVPPSRKGTLYIVTAKQEIFRAAQAQLCRLAFAETILVTDKEPEGAAEMVSCLTHDATMFMPMQDLVDIAKELQRIAKERAKAEDELKRTEAKLQNEKFTARAPAQVVEAERAKAEKARALLVQLQESAQRLEKLAH